MEMYFYLIQNMFLNILVMSFDLFVPTRDVLKPECKLVRVADTSNLVP